MSTHDGSPEVSQEDAAILVAVRHALLSTPATGVARVNATVFDRVVTLTGTVDSDEQRYAMKRAVLSPKKTCITKL